MTKKLTKVAMTTALAAAAIVPAVVATPAQAAEAEVTFAKAYYTTDNGTAAFAAGNLAGVISATGDTGITHLEASNGEVFTMQAFSAYLAVNSTATTDQVLTALSTAGKALSADQVKALDVKEGKVDGGKVTVDPTAVVKTALNEAIAKAEASPKAAELKDAITAAKAVAENADATQAEVDAAVKALNEAIAEAEAVTELKVESVKAINLKQYVVTFNKAVDKTSAEDKANYNFDKAALAAGDVVKLNADGKSVTVTLANANNNQDVKEVAVKDVKDTNGVKIADYKADATFLDLTIPTVVNAKQIAPNEVQVFFSEPVQGAGFLIDGGKYSATVKSYDDATNSVILTTGTLQDGEHTITVNPNSGDTIRDYANLKVAKTDVKFTVAADTTAPTLVSAEAKTQTEVILTFSEPIDAATLANNVYHTAETAAYRANASATEVAGSNGTQYTVTFANPIPAGTATFLVAKEAAKDKFGNKNAAVLQVTAPVAVDTVKPTVTELKYVDTSKAEITLSEEVTGADVKGNFKVTDKDGKAVAFTVSGYTDKDKTVTLNFNPALKEGAKYTVEVTGLKDKAVVPNEMDKYTSTFTATDVTGPTVQSTGVYNTTDRTITVFFNEAVDGTTALDKSKYTLRYAAGGSKELALPSDATVSLGGNNTSVTIKLPTTIKDSAGTDISSSINGVVVGQVKDVAGNKSQTFTLVNFTAAGNLDNTNVITDSAKTTDTRTVQFEVDTPLKSIAVADFTVNSTNAEFATFENKTLSDGSYGALVTLKVPEANEWATDTTPVIATKDQAMVSETLYGGKFAQNTVTLATATDGVAPAVATTGTPAVDDVVVTDAELANGTPGQDGIVDTITVTYTETLKASTVSVDDFQVSGYEVKDLSISGNAVVLKIKQASAANFTDTFVVKQVGNISDAADNVFAGNATKEYKSIAKTVAAAPTSGVTFDVAAGTVTGLSTTYEYSLDGGTTYVTTAAGVDFTAGPVLVRTKATASALPSAPETVGTIASAATAPTSGVTFDVAAGTVTGLSTTYEYSLDGGTTYVTTAAGVDFTAGPVLVRTKATSTALPSAPETVGTIAAAATAPNAASEAGTSSGNTKLTGLTDGTTYEYVLSTSATVPTDWSGATSITLSGSTEIDSIVKSTNTHIHVRVKATATALASQVKTLEINAAS